MKFVFFFFLFRRISTGPAEIIRIRHDSQSRIYPEKKREKEKILLDFRIKVDHLIQAGKLDLLFRFYVQRKYINKS